MPRKVACTIQDTILRCNVSHSPPASTANPIFKMPRMVALRTQSDGASVCATHEQADKPKSQNTMHGCTNRDKSMCCSCQQCPPASTTDQEAKCHAWLLAPFRTQFCGASACAAHQRALQARKSNATHGCLHPSIITQSCGASVCTAHQGAPQTRKPKRHA